VGLGLFTPVNNAAIVGAVPVASAGTVAGMMNLARGLGTAAGVAIAAVSYSAAATPATGLRNTGLVLTLLAALALPGSLGGLSRRTWRGAAARRP
jgi:hypothetical protein